ncbi:MAG: HAD family hydrolase [Candidatus Pacebacteria bacterium]|jgi:phosphoglycolate phosphatase-like HAD superfamily hydrolase|nr:HAD family hydrolase [Candidatus Paceibacterota bacterium]
MIKVVIVDFDDTLTMTEEAFFNIENEVAAGMGFAPMTRQVHQKNWGTTINKAIAERIPGIDTDEFVKRLVKYLPKCVASGKVDTISERNIGILKQLNQTGMRLAILTNRRIAEVKHLLDETHILNSLFEKIYHADNLDYLKPDPRAFAQSLEYFEVKPDEAVYVGDSVGDGISAKGAGLHFIALLESGLRTRDYFAPVNVDFFAHKFPDILDYIK